MTHHRTFPESFAVGAVLFVAAMLAAQPAAAGDSTDLPTGFKIAKKPSSSIIGSATDGRLCRYHGNDGLLHCNAAGGGSSPPQEYLAESTHRPQFRNFGTNTEGRMTVTQGARYAYLNAETVDPIGDGSVSVHCKLALQFQIASGDTFWIWHDEIRFGASGETAYVDSDGDGHADFAVNGQWTGRVNGTRRWSTFNPNNASYTAAQRVYPARPYFGKTGSRRRNCRTSEVIVAQLIDAASNINSDITGNMRDTLGVTDD